MLRKLAEATAERVVLKAVVRELAERVGKLESAEARRRAARGGGLARYHAAVKAREQALAPVRQGLRIYQGGGRAALQLAAAAVTALLALADSLAVLEAVVLERLGLTAEKEKPHAD